MMKVKQFNVFLFFAALAQQTLVAAVNANPTGATVINGQVSFSQPDATSLQITNSPGSIINWQNFNISAQEMTQFVQQNAASAILNRVVGGNASEILGKLQSNGKVFLINPNGLVIGQDAVINTAGFIGSTLNISDEDFLNGQFHFEGQNAAGIDNQGYIHAGANGDILLIAPNITNSGVLEVDGGNILLAAGQSITIASLDDANISFEVQAAEDSVTNLGQLIANNGAANIFAGTLTHTGSVSANAITTDAAGNIRLVAKDTNWIEGDVTATGSQGGNIQLLGAQVGLDGNAVIDASGTNGGGEILVGGDYQGQGEVQTARASYVGENVQIKADALENGDGGKVIVWGDESTKMYGGITARGGALSGDGGFIETSGGFLDIGSIVPDAGASNGVGGTWLLDPNNISIVAGTGNTNIPTVSPFTSTADSAVLGVDLISTALSQGADVIVQTGPGGTQQGNITWGNLVFLDITGAGNGRTLTLNAHNDILIDGQIGGDILTQNINLTINADFDGNGQGSFTLGTNADMFLSAGTVASVFKVNAADGINILGNVNTSTNAGALISLHSNTGLIDVDTNSSLTTETLELSSTSTVNATINALSSSIANLSANMGAASNINYSATSGINLNAINAVGGSLTIDTAGALTQTGAIVTGTLDIVNAGNVTLNNSANDVDVITASTTTFGGTPLLFSFTDLDDLEVQDINISNQSTSLASSFLDITSGGDMTLNGVINASGGAAGSGISLSARNSSSIIYQSGVLTSDNINFQNDGLSTTTGAVGSAANPVEVAALASSIAINLGEFGSTSGAVESGGDLFVRNTNGILVLGDYLTPTASILQLQNTVGDINLLSVFTVDAAGITTPGELTASSITLRANGLLLLPIFNQIGTPGLTSTVGDIFFEANNLSINQGDALIAAGDVTLISRSGALTIDDLVTSSAGNVELIGDSFVINSAVTAQNQVIVREFSATNGLEVNAGTPTIGYATLTTAGLGQLTGTTQGILLGNSTGNKSVVLVSNINSSMINGPRLTLETTNSGIAKINANIDFTGDNENLVFSGNGFAEIGPGSVPGNILIDTGAGNLGSTVSQLDILGNGDSGVIVRTDNAGITGNLFVSSGSLAGSSALFTGNNLTLQGALGISADGANATVGFTNAINITSPSSVVLSAGNLLGAKARLLAGGDILINASGDIQMLVGTAADTDAYISAGGGLGTVVLNYANCQGCDSRIILNPEGNGLRDRGIRAATISRNGVVSGIGNRRNPVPTLSALFQRFVATRLRRAIEDEKERKKLLICT